MKLATIPNINSRVPTALLLIAGVVLAFGPNLVLHCMELWEQEQYRYFPFVIAAIVWLGSTRWTEATARPKPDLRFRWIPYVLLTAAIPLLCLSIYSRWPWLTVVTFNLTAGAGIFFVTRRTYIRNAWGIWLLFWLMTPPPIEFGVYIVQQLQLFSSVLSSKALDLIPINHVMQGNVLFLPSKQLFVDEACSGIVSLMSVVAIVAIYAVWQDRSLVHFLLLGFLAVIWAVVMNTVRICAVAVAESYYAYNLAEGLPHQILGLVLFLLTFLAVVSTDRLLQFLLAPIKVSKIAARNPLIPRWNRFVEFLKPVDRGEPKQKWEVSFYDPMLKYFGIAFIGIGVWSSIVAAGILEQRISAIDSLTVHQHTNVELLPAKIGDWKFIDFEVIERGEDGLGFGYEFGRYSKQFTYATDDMQAIVSLDFPFRGGWHELAACYRSKGWQINERLVKHYRDGGHVEADLQASPDRHGFLTFSNFHANGDMLSPASSAILSRTWIFIRRRLLERVSRDVYQTQVMVNSAKPLDAGRRAAVRTLFRECQRRFMSHVKNLTTDPTLVVVASTTDIKDLNGDKNSPNDEEQE